MVGAHRFRQIAADFVERWDTLHCTRKAAALSFYTAFSLAPILALVVAVVSVVVDESNVRGALVNQVRQLMGPDGASLVQTMLASASEMPRGKYALIAILVLLFGATTAFAELKQSLDEFMGAAPQKGGTFFQFLRQRVLSFGLVLSLAFILLVAMVANAVARAATGAVAGALGWQDAVLVSVLTEAISIGGAFVLFGAIYALLPDRRLPRSRLLFATFFTTMLFTAGRLAIGYYLERAEISAAFGPAGSLAIVLAWVYYAALVFFAGALLATGIASGAAEGRAVEHQDSLHPKAEAANDGRQRGEALASQPAS